MCGLACCTAAPTPRAQSATPPSPNPRLAPQVMRRIVRFASVENDARFPAGFSPEAGALITVLLDPTPESRLGGGSDGIVAVQQHPFLASLGDPALLYQQTPPPLKGGVVPPNPHAAWTRRHNSMMWSPLPQRYAFAEDEQPLSPLPETAVEANAPFRTQQQRLPALTEAAMPRLGDLKSVRVPNLD